MYHCKQCRADAIGTLDNDRSRSLWVISVRDAMTRLKPVRIFHCFCGGNKTNIYIDQLFGHADGFSINKYSKSGIRFLERRSIMKYCKGAKECEQEEKIEISRGL
jgi:nitrogenase molybdenum-iron protein NifN